MSPSIHWYIEPAAKIEKNIHFTLRCLPRSHPKATHVPLWTRSTSHCFSRLSFIPLIGPWLDTHWMDVKLQFLYIIINSGDERKPLLFWVIIHDFQILKCSFALPTPQPLLIVSTSSRKYFTSSSHFFSYISKQTLSN